MINSKLNLLIVSLALACYLFCISSYKNPILEPDSPTYLEFAKSICDGTVFDSVSPAELSISRAVRTPGYPALICLAQLAFGGAGGEILIVHLMLGLLTIVYLSFALKEYIPSGFTALFTTIGLLEFDQYFPTVLTEWSALCFILLIFGAAVRMLQSPGLFTAALLALLGACGILIRPALIVVAPLTVLLAVFFVQKGRGKALSGVIIGFLPVILWMWVNNSTIGVFKLAAFDGVSLFGVASSISSAAKIDSDPSELKEFIDYVNFNKQPKPGSERSVLENDFKAVMTRHYSENIYLLGMKFPRFGELGVVRMNELMGIYSKRAIKAEPYNYALYIYKSLLFAWGKKWEVIILLILGVGMYLARHSAPLAVGGLFILGIHLAHSLLCASVTIIHLRYLQLTYIPVCIAAAILAVSCVRSKFKNVAK